MSTQVHISSTVPSSSTNLYLFVHTMMYMYSYIFALSIIMYMSFVYMHTTIDLHVADVVVGNGVSSEVILHWIGVC